jgi:hypothetical protein
MLRIFNPCCRAICMRSVDAVVERARFETAYRAKPIQKAQTSVPFEFVSE